MIVRKNIHIYDICWLNHAQGGMIGTYYEPETKEELTQLCCSLYYENKKFDIIGHTSNIYFLPSYNVEIMVSTRKVRNYEVMDDCIICDCGTSVRLLARNMVNNGISGFEGLVDLPGTVAASVIGNASCYDCSINQLLISFEMLKPDGNIVNLTVSDLNLSRRSSAIKRGEMDGVILSIKLKKIIGDKSDIKIKAEKNHLTRMQNQPTPEDCLGSVFYDKGSHTITFYMVHIVIRICSIICKYIGMSNKRIISMKKSLEFILLGLPDISRYVAHWNCFKWKDECSHEAFWIYVKAHKKMYTKSDFEIIIKG